jgi:DNA-directed RNA polymerase specialized sigma24 family protein
MRVRARHRGLERRPFDALISRYFGGLSVAETAAVLKISPETVMGDWKLARTWLRRELRR